MARETDQIGVSRCIDCGFEATSASPRWVRMEAASGASVLRCPECDSTSVRPNPND